MRPPRDPAAGRRHGRRPSTQALAIAERIGYPVLVRPSLRARRPGHGDRLRRRRPRARRWPSSPASARLGREGGLSAERPVLVDRFLEDATEVDVDAIRDGTGDVRHRRGHGARRGGRACTRATRACVDPAATRCRAETIAVIEELHPAHRRRARRPWACINVQYAVKGGQVFVIEANPRASRTVPFVAKATGVPLAKVAGPGDGRRHARRAARRGPAAPSRSTGGHVAVKEAVLPFNRFPDVDTVLGPEMRSTGEVMGIDRTFGLAFAKSQIAAGDRPARRRARCSSRSPTATRRSASRPPGGSSSSASRSRPPRAPPTHLEARRRPGRHASWPRSARPTGTTRSTSSRAGKVDLVVNSPRGPRPAGRRRPHPRRRRRPRGPAAHHGGRRPGRGQRHGRLGRATSSRVRTAAGVPPRRRRATSRRSAASSA